MPMTPVDALEARRQRMNQRGRLFDHASNQSRYDSTLSRGASQNSQLNDISSRERMLRQQLGTDMAMQGADIASRYGLAAQEAKNRERLAAQSFGNTMAQLNSEYGFKAGESMKSRDHTKSMTQLESELREVASSKDFQRDLEKLAVQFGMSKEEATIAFNRMLEGKQFDQANQLERDAAQHGYGQQDMQMQNQLGQGDMRLQSKLGERAAQSQFGRDANMLGLESKYDMQGNAQKHGFNRDLQEQQFGFDKQVTELDRNLGLRNLDQQFSHNQQLNEQQFNQAQQQQQAQLMQAQDQQLTAALDSAMLMYDNLDPQGQQALDKANADLAEINADPGFSDAEKLQRRLQYVKPNVHAAMNASRIKNPVKEYGGVQYLQLPGMKEPERLGFNPDKAPPRAIDANGVKIITNPNGEIHSVIGANQYMPRQSSNSGMPDQPGGRDLSYKDAMEMANGMLAKENPETGELIQPNPAEVVRLADTLVAGGMPQQPQPQQNRQIPEVERLRPYMDEARARGDEATAQQIGERILQIKREAAGQQGNQPQQWQRNQQPQGAELQQPLRPQGPTPGVSGASAAGSRQVAQQMRSQGQPDAMGRGGSPVAMQLAKIAQQNPDAAKAYRDLEILQSIPKDQWGDKENAAYRNAVNVFRSVGGGR